MLKSGEYESVVMTSHNIGFLTDYDLKQKDNYDHYCYPVKV